MGALIAIWRLLPAKVWAFLAIAAFALSVFGFAKCQHDRAERAEAEARQAAERAAALERRAQADAAAADRRLTDAIKSNAAAQELHDAVDALPDARPSDRRIALACARLRRQREPVLPPVCGPEA